MTEGVKECQRIIDLCVQSQKGLLMSYKDGRRWLVLRNISHLQKNWIELIGSNQINIKWN